MSKERDQFFAAMGKENVPYGVAREVCRRAATLHRLAEASCNGTWPYNGTGTYTCHVCQTEGLPRSFVVGALEPARLNHGATVLSFTCRDCRISAHVTEILKPFNVSPVFSGDPRGAVVKLRVPSGATDDWGKEGICVPTR